MRTINRIRARIFNPGIHAWADTHTLPNQIHGGAVYIFALILALLMFLSVLVLK